MSLSNCTSTWLCKGFALLKAMGLVGVDAIWYISSMMYSTVL